MTSCYGRELSILDKMRTAGRIFFSHFAKILMTVGNKSFVGKGGIKILLGRVSDWGGFGHFSTDREGFSCPSHNGKTILINFSLLQYIKVTFAAFSVTVAS